MDNNHFDAEFHEFVHSCAEATDKPKTLAQLIEERGRIPSAAELCEARLGAFRREPARDPFEVLTTAEEAVAQQRIAQEIRRPTEIKKSATTEPTFEGEAKPEPGDLLYLLLGENEVGDNEPPAIVGVSSVPNRGRVGGSSFAKSTGGPRGSFLNRPFDKVLEAVAGRASVGAAEFARSMAAQARELEVS
jgi:hypothetical protein